MPVDVWSQTIAYRKSLIVNSQSKAHRSSYNMSFKLKVVAEA